MLTIRNINLEASIEFLQKLQLINDSNHQQIINRPTSQPSW